MIDDENVYFSRGQLCGLAFVILGLVFYAGLKIGMNTERHMAQKRALATSTQSVSADGVNTTSVNINVSYVKSHGTYFSYLTIDPETDLLKEDYVPIDRVRLIEDAPDSDSESVDLQQEVACGCEANPTGQHAKRAIFHLEPGGLEALYSK